MRRQYIHSRRAYTPRLWPQVLITVIIVFPTFFVDLPAWTYVAIPAVVSFSISHGTWLLWKLRYPPIPKQQQVREYLQAMRDNATWN